MKAGFDPALHDALTWTVVRHGIRWRRTFHTQDAAWRALCGACYASAPWTREKMEAEKTKRQAAGYSVKPTAWTMKKEKQSSLELNQVLTDRGHRAILSLLTKE